MIDIDIRTALKNEGESGIFHYDGLADLGSDIVMKEPLVLDAEYCVNDRKVCVKGSFQATLSMTCDRCLADTEIKIQRKFDEMFWPAGAQEEEEYTYQKEMLSLDKMVYDEIVLSLPHQLLCREDCKGICPKCGKDLNDGACECAEDTDETNPFAKLKGLF